MLGPGCVSAARKIDCRESPLNEGAAIRAAGCVEFLPACSSAVLGKISGEWETERAYLNMEAT